MSNKIITADVAKEFVTKAKEKGFTVLTKDYEEVKNSELDALFPTFEELSMENWMKNNVADYATVTDVPNDFYLTAATHKVTSLKGAFAGCAALTTLEQFETRNVTDFTGMFNGCTALPSVLEFVFQCDAITDVSQVAGMFTGSSAKTVSLANLNGHIGAILITNPKVLGDINAAIINGYYIEVKAS